MIDSPFVSPWRPLGPMRGRVPEALWSWLSDRGSLTRRLQSQCTGRFEVRVLGQYRARPAAHEARILGMRHGVSALIREVHLVCANTPWVFARTVIPPATLHGHRALAQLGTRSLGSALFADPTLTRGIMEVSALRPADSLYRRTQGGDDGAVWGRRSVFRLSGWPLLVSEFFLPALLSATEAA